MAAKPVPQILRLNDDCLDEIFDRLQDLPTEVSFAKTCQRLQHICLAKWRTSRAYEHLDLDKWRELLPNYEDLVYFLTQMRPHIREMSVSSCLCAVLKDLDEMHIAELPLVASFYYDPEDVDCYPSNRSIRKLAQLLPGLRYHADLLNPSPADQGGPTVRGVETEDRRRSRL